MRGKFIAVYIIAADILLMGCTALRTVDDEVPPAVAPVTAGGGSIVRIAQTTHPAPRGGKGSMPHYSLCGGTVACPEVTKKTFDMVRPVSFLPTVALPRPTPLTPVTRSVSVFFSFASAELPADRTPIQKLLKDIQAADRISLAGRTDIVGAKVDNDLLALRRAKAVKKYLVGQGIEAWRISIEAVGKCCYAASNGTPEGRTANRRVEVLITIMKQEEQKV